MALAPRLSPQATAFFMSTGVLKLGFCTKNASVAHIPGAKHAANIHAPELGLSIELYNLSMRGGSSGDVLDPSGITRGLQQ